MLSSFFKGWRQHALLAVMLFKKYLGRLICLAMKIKYFIALLFLTVVFTAIPFSYQALHHQTNGTYVSGPVCFILTDIFMYRTSDSKKSTVILASTIGALFSFVIKVGVDWTYDPTSHNLIPFEFIIYFGLTYLFSLAGSSIGTSLKGTGAPRN